VTHSGIIWGIPSGDAKKMGAVAPIDLLLIHEPQVRSVDERRGCRQCPYRSRRSWLSLRDLTQESRHALPAW
jgi:hypothetical protein